MKKTVHTFTIWVLAALINALLSASCLFFTGHESWPGAFMLSLIFTLLFSCPGIFIFWVTFISTPKNDAAYLFRRLLKCTIIAAAVSATGFAVLFHGEFANCIFLLGWSIVIAGIVAVLAHNGFIVAICKNNIRQDDNHNSM